MNSTRKDTGIYVQEWWPDVGLWSADNPDDLSKVKEAVRQHNLALDWDHMLNGAEQLANDVLEADRTNELPPQVDRDVMVNDANAVLQEVQCVRLNHDAGDLRTTGVFMFRLGRKYERLLIRFVEHYADVGKRVSHKNRIQGPHFNVAEVVAYFESELQRRGGAEKRGAKKAAMTATTRKFGCDESTVKRYRKM